LLGLLILVRFGQQELIVSSQPKRSPDENVSNLGHDWISRGRRDGQRCRLEEWWVAYAVLTVIDGGSELLIFVPRGSQSWLVVVIRRWSGVLARCAAAGGNLRWLPGANPYSEPGRYINFMQDDDYDKIQDNYRQNYDRLVQVKRAYDPGNLFHINQNITP
jgi:hypothetical protein